MRSVSIAWIIFATGLTVSARRPHRPIETGHADLTTQILKFDIAAINAAAWSGDQKYVPPLKHVVAAGEPSADAARKAAHFALARLDDRDELQKLWCESISEEATPTNKQVLDLNVGGWFAILSLARFLEPGVVAHWHLAVQKYDTVHPELLHNDVASLPLNYEIITILNELVPTAKLFVPDLWDSDAIRQRIGEWRLWIPEHATELQSRSPRGEGVRLTDDACNRNGTVRSGS
jgi:hypothetical protein